MTEELTALGISSVLEAPTFELAFNPHDAASAQAAGKAAAEATAKVEAECPFGLLHGVSGFVEGIVWVPLGPHWGRSKLFFKTKGDKHKVTKTRTKVKVAPEVLAGIAAFVEFAVTDNRLRQGFDVLHEQGLAKDMKNLGAYLKWVSQDIQRECAGDLEASGLSWKDVAGAVTRKARQFFKAELGAF